MIFYFSLFKIEKNILFISNLTFLLIDFESCLSVPCHLLSLSRSGEHRNTHILWPSWKSLRTVIALVLLAIELQSRGTSLANVQFVIVYWFAFGADTFEKLLIPDHVVWTTLTHLVLWIVPWRAWRTFSAFFINLIVVLIFIGITVSVLMMLLMESVCNCK